MAYSTDMLNSLMLIHQGKVRDSFALDEDHMMIVASDRLSAFDIRQYSRERGPGGHGQ